MNIVSKLTLRHLKENKSRTVVTTLGIGVSVAMITAVFVALASFLNLFGEIDWVSVGHRHALMDVSYTQYEQLKKDSRIEEVGFMADLGDKDSFQLEKTGSQTKAPTGSFVAGDSVYLKQMITGDYDGKIPEKENEIAVEESFIKSNKLNWKVGDTVSVPVGYRYVEGEDGEQRINVKRVSGDERFELKDIVDYKITAILHTNPATTRRTDILVNADPVHYSTDKNAVYGASIVLKDLNYKSITVIKDIVKEYKIENYNMNSEYLASKLAIDPSNSSVMSLLPMIAVILVIIMIASVVLIYNSFAMSISERTRYLGMLASVGATKRQKKQSVYYEGMILSAFGIPLGIGAGIAGIGITLKLLGKKIIETGMISGVDENNMEMKVVVPLWVIVGVVIVSLLTVFISSVIPSHKASSITPIDAIRQNKEFKVKAKSLKSPKLVRKIFGYEGELAYKNLKRNGKKARVITVSIAMSVILFLSCNYFCQMFMQANGMETPSYQIMAYVDYDKKDAFEKELDKIDGIDKIYAVNNDSYEIGGSVALPDGAKVSLNDKNCLNANYKKAFDSKTFVYINAVKDEDFNELCKENNIDYNKYYGSGAGNALLLNNINHSSQSEVYNDKILKTQFKYMPEAMPFTVEDFIKYDSKAYACNLNPQNSISLYVPLSVYHKYQTTTYPDDTPLYLIGIETKEHKAVAESIDTLFSENDYGNESINDYVEQMEMISTILFVMQVFIYGFIALITLITVANILNTIATGIASRRKEFAMLKSVGITPSGFRKMVSLESAFYGMNALLVSIPISVLISFGMNLLVASNRIPFEINWLIYLAVILAVFIIVGSSMLYSVRKIRKDNIIETLKEDIS